jgi:antitoxin ParD1/3/4
MVVKPSVSLTDDQHAYARALVDSGRYASVSAVLQQGLLALREREEAAEAERAALHELMERRRVGPFVEMDEARARTEAMIARKRRERGL